MILPCSLQHHTTEQPSDTVLNHVYILYTIYQMLIQQVSLAFFSFHQLWKQKTHESVLVNITRLDTAPNLNSCQI